MLEKYRRKFQTDDENLEFAEGTFAFFHIISYMVCQYFHSSINVSGEKELCSRIIICLLPAPLLILQLAPLCEIGCAPFSGKTPKGVIIFYVERGPSLCGGPEFFFG